MTTTQNQTYPTHYVTVAPVPLKGWDRLVDSNPICHLLWSYSFTARKIVRDLRGKPSSR